MRHHPISGWIFVMTPFLFQIAFSDYSRWPAKIKSHFVSLVAEGPNKTVSSSCSRCNSNFRALRSQMDKDIVAVRWGS